MPNSRSKASKTSDKKRNTRGTDKRLSARTKKQIVSLPEHAQHIYKKTHDGAIEQYQDPKRDVVVKGRVQKRWHIKQLGLL